MFHSIVPNWTWTRFFYCSWTKMGWGVFLVLKGKFIVKHIKMWAAFKKHL